MMDIEQFRKAGYAAIDRICDYYTSLESKDVVSSVQPGYLSALLPDRAPEEGEDFEAITSDWDNQIMPGITHWQSPNFFAYFPSNTSLPGILADLYAASVSNPGFNWSCSPACTELEAIVMDWGCRLLGLDDGFLTAGGIGGGIIMGSASESVLTVAIAARERALRVIADKETNATHPSLVEHGSAGVPGSSVPSEIRNEYSQKLVMYGSTQTHSVGAKAALILGHIWRSIPVPEDDLSLTGDLLRIALEEDKAKGLIPFMVIGSMGTTSSGIVDRFSEIGEVIKDYPTIHFHADCAWAGIAMACPEYRDYGQLEAINKYTDSFCTNWHKWGLVNFDCSGLWVKERKRLTEALDVTPEFLRTKESEKPGLVIDYRNWQIALGRKFRSLKLWFVLRTYGVTGLQAHIRSHINLASTLVTLVEASQNYKLVAPPSLALVVFRIAPKDASSTELNALNRALYARISARKEILLTQTMLPGDIFCIRFAIGSPTTRESHIQNAWRIIEEEGAALLASR